MNTRLKQFLAAENISQSQFADTIKVVRASVSHVLAGRNNPGYDFITSVMNAYPSLNIEWLLLGKGKMYKEVQQEASQRPLEVPQYVSSQEPDLFSYDDVIQEPVIDAPQELPSVKIPDVQRKVSKVIIFFDDGSYQEMGN